MREINISNKTAYVAAFVFVIILASVMVNSAWMAPSPAVYHDASEVKITVDGTDYNLQEAVANGLVGADCSSSGTCSQVCMGSDCRTQWPDPTLDGVCNCIDADGDGYYPESCTDADCDSTDCDGTEGNIFPGSDWFYGGSSLKDADCDGTVEFQWIASEDTATEYFNNPVEIEVSTTHCESRDHYNCVGAYISDLTGLPTDRCDFDETEIYTVLDNPVVEKCKLENNYCVVDYYSWFQIENVCQ